MQLAIRLALTLMILYFGIKAFRLENGDFNLGIFYQLEHLPFVVLLLVTLAVVMIDITSRKENKSIFHYSVSAIGLLFVGVIMVKKLQHNRIDSQPTLIRVENIPGAQAVMRIDFKAGGRFRLIRYDPLGQTMFYGNWHRKGDSIIIGSANFEGDPGQFPKAGRIQGDTVFWNNAERMIIRR
jgi:hypothetical protein